MTTEGELIALLGETITEHKRSKIAEVLDERTRHLTILLEDIYQPHNASACLRSCECLGVQDVHIVESRNEYRPNTEVAMGSSKWLSMHRYHSTEACLATLRSQGYRLVATSPAADGHDLTTLPLDQPLAIMFGTEEQGLESDTLAAADMTLRLPMYGFTESYNISVTVALTLARLTERLRESGVTWELSDEEKEALTLEFYRRIVKRHDLIEARYWENRASDS